MKWLFRMTAMNRYDLIAVIVITGYVQTDFQWWKIPVGLLMLTASSIFSLTIERLLFDKRYPDARDEVLHALSEGWTK